MATLDEPITTTIVGLFPCTFDVYGDRQLGAGPSVNFSQADSSPVPSKTGPEPRGLEVSSSMLNPSTLIDCASRDWDLWGPLVLCLGLGALLSLNVRVSCFVDVTKPSWLATGTTREFNTCVHDGHRYCVVGIIRGHRSDQGQNSADQVQCER